MNIINHDSEREDEKEWASKNIRWTAIITIIFVLFCLFILIAIALFYPFGGVG